VNGGEQSKRKYPYPPVSEMQHGMNIIGSLCDDVVDDTINFEYIHLGTITAFSASLSPKEVFELANASGLPGFRGRLLLSLPSFCDSISAKVGGDVAPAAEQPTLSPATFPDHFRKNPANTLQRGGLSFEKEITSIAQHLLRVYPGKVLFSYNGTLTST
jgi:hypothetical protein